MSVCSTAESRLGERFSEVKFLFSSPAVTGSQSATLNHKREQVKINNFYVAMHTNLIKLFNKNVQM